ncbi:MAG: tetratricopeptide repeat protein [Microscillaceae bacterium]|nr:tetratricopeptide repeat protein [Microscillaceae bacterium]
MDLSAYFIKVKDLEYLQQNLPDCEIILGVKGLWYKNIELNNFKPQNQAERDSLIQERIEQLKLAEYIYHQNRDTEDKLYWLMISTGNLAYDFENNNQADSAYKYCQEAVNLQDKLIEANPENKEYLRESYYDNLASLCLDNQKYQEAVYYGEKNLKQMQKSTELGDDSYLQGAYDVLAFMYLYNQQYPEAQEAARRSLEINPDKNYAHLSLARALLLQGKFEEAKKIFVEKKDFSVF